MRKKENRKLDKKTRSSLIGLIVLLLLTSGILTFLFAFRIQEIIVEGNIHYTNDEVIAMVLDDSFLSENSIVLSITKKEIELENTAFINTIQVQMIDHNSIRIRVNEKSVVGYVECDNAYWYFNREGIVVEKCATPAMTAEERITLEENEKLRAEAEAQGITVAVTADLTAKNFVPEVRGFTFQKVELNKQLPVKDDSIFNSLYSINQMMNKDNIPVDFVMFDDKYNISLYYGDIIVLLGQDDHLEEKMSTLASILPEAAGLSGTLHLENYEDIKTGVVFKKFE